MLNAQTCNLRRRSCNRQSNININLSFSCVNYLNKYVIVAIKKQVF